MSASRDKQFGQLILPALNCAICWEHLSPSLFVLYDLSQLAGNLIYLNSLGILRDSTPEFIFCGYPSSVSISVYLKECFQQITAYILLLKAEPDADFIINTTIVIVMRP